ncbi:four helix bundle protein [Pseudomonas aeruginosa]|uniref:four helix bundle protein n=1 Tax=Pseudomonas aeruginosa TaxID=287 RepID=UPI001F131ADF|nr:four helix bundle protein [Pseudomonas aeruginosa]MCS8090292.1 four helix bundle protein [Pseudomonas aeruginosa]MCS9004432.1 four helix bundle protein [Pseudomonas aeruginosa]WDZ01532.1 four helix bundle protein [Pseudomonas aeruginosa]
MAMHTELQIHKTAEELLSLTLSLVRNIPRDLKQVIGSKLRDEALQILVLIGRANMARNKLEHLSQLLESIWMVNYLLRALANQRLISLKQHSSAMQLTASIGKQENAWKGKFATAPWRIHTGGEICTSTLRFLIFSERP